MSALRGAVCVKLGLPLSASQGDIYRAALDKIALRKWQVGESAETTRHVPASPSPLPSGVRVSIAEISKQRGQSPRYRVVSSSGQSYWVDEDALG